MEREIIEVIRYFERFGYPPSEVEIYTFISSKISRVLLKKGLNILVTKKKLIKSHSMGKFTRYTLENRENFFQQQKKREKISQKKLKKVRLYLKLLKLIPQIKLVGLSGTLAMMNAEKEDDIDLFIITAKNRLFTGRFLALILAQILGIRRLPITNNKLPITNDRVCLNLFFDESNLRVPDYKARPYVAHEVLQMKPMINKDQTYEKFLQANEWVYELFPNGKSQISNFKFLISNQFQKFKINNLGDWIERILKKLQLYLVRKHQTNEIVTDSQLWFHPEDFGNKLKD